MTLECVATLELRSRCAGIVRTGGVSPDARRHLSGTCACARVYKPAVSEGGCSILHTLTSSEMLGRGLLSVSLALPALALPPTQLDKRTCYGSPDASCNFHIQNCVNAVRPTRDPENTLAHSASVQPGFWYSASCLAAATCSSVSARPLHIPCSFADRSCSRSIRCSRHSAARTTTASIPSNSRVWTTTYVPSRPPPPAQH